MQFSLSGLALGLVVATGLWAWQRETLTQWREWTDGSVVPHAALLWLGLLYFMCVAVAVPNRRRFVAWLQS